MNIQALLVADPVADLFGAPGTLGEDLAGRPVLARTLERLAAVDGLDGILVAAESEAMPQVQEWVASAPVRWIVHDGTSRQARAMRAARAFGRYGWRGGLAGTTIFDEAYDPVLTAKVLQETGADALFLVQAGSALLDVGWAGEMLAFCRDQQDRQGLAFCQAPPGLAGAVFGAQLLTSLGVTRLYPGKLLAYDPHAPVLDPISKPFNHRLPDWLIATPRRFLADSPRGLWLCRQVVQVGGVDVDGQTACRIAQDLPAEPWPREVTVELTTRRPVHDDLRPSAERGDLSIQTLAELLDGLQEVGDLNIMLGGAGDALLHPDWPRAVAEARKVGCVGLATYGTSLDEDVCRQLAESGLEVLQVYVDAVSDEVYAAHKRGSSAGQVWEGIEAVIRGRDEADCPGPMVVPTMLKTLEALDEQDAFFDRSLRAAGWGLIVEPSSAAGQWEDHAVVHMAPPKRSPCRRLSTRLTALADGRLAMCEEDIHGVHTLGCHTVLDAWRSDDLAGLRRIHAQGDWQQHRLCAACEEFHRP